MQIWVFPPPPTARLQRGSLRSVRLLSGAADGARPCGRFGRGRRGSAGRTGTHSLLRRVKFPFLLACICGYAKTISFPCGKREQVLFFLEQTAIQADFCQWVWLCRCSWPPGLASPRTRSACTRLKSPQAGAFGLEGGYVCIVSAQYSKSVLPSKQSLLNETCIDSVNVQCSMPKVQLSIQ